jgi:hypothetical protein
VRLHAPAEQVEAEIEVARVLRIEREERERRRAEALGRIRPSGERSRDRVAEAFERGFENLGIDRLLGIEVEVERGRRIARPRRDGAQRRAVEALGLEDRPRGVQDQGALQPGRRPPPSCLDRHPAPSLDAEF